MASPALSSNGPPLVTQASLAAVGSLGDRGPFHEVPEDSANQLLALGELVGTKAGSTIVEQYHQGKFFYFLLQGSVDFEISLESAGSLINVGAAERPWTPIGWSGFRAPNRYATTVRARSDVELLRFPVSKLAALFNDHPRLGWHFLRAITRPAEQLLFEARERLVNHLRSSTSISHWGSAFDRARAVTRRPGKKRISAFPATTSRIPSQEAMVTNAAPETFELLQQSPFFESFPEELLSVIAARSSVHYFCRGDVLLSQGGPANNIQVLGDGRLRIEYSGRSMRTAVLGIVTERGSILSSAAPCANDEADITVRATRDGSLLEIPQRALEEALEYHPAWACLFQKRVLWLLSRQLRATRAHLVSEAFDGEVLAIESVLEQVRTELSVSSPLHKLPHLLRAAVTLPDALAIVDRERSSMDRLSAHTAAICHELLTPVRRENRFFAGLQATYETVVNAPPTEKAQDTRKRAAESFIRVFSEIPTELRGLHYLPRTSGHIFIFNHLKNHDHNTLPNGFQLTLDSHFISSMILHKTYGDPGVRVVRQSRANEYGHQNYYARQGHISVYTRESDTPTQDRSERFAEFVEAASDHLRMGHNLVLAPEGTSYSTEMSPGRLKPGAFRLAAAIQPEPLIVPIAMAYFDRRLAHGKLVAIVHEPFRISDHLQEPGNPDEMNAFLLKFQTQFGQWVREAAALGGAS